MDRAQALERQGHRSTILNSAIHGWPPPREIIEATMQAIEAKQLGYAPDGRTSGAARGAGGSICIADRSRDDDAQVVISPANLLIHQFLDIPAIPETAVVLFTPAFPSYWAAAAPSRTSMSCRSRWLRHNGFHLGASRRLNAATRTAEGDHRQLCQQSDRSRVYPSHVGRLLRGGAKKNRIWLLSDETYADLSFGWPFFSLACTSPLRRWS